MIAPAEQARLERLRSAAETLSARTAAAIAAADDLEAAVLRSEFLRYRATAVSAAGQLAGAPPLQYQH